MPHAWSLITGLNNPPPMKNPSRRARSRWTLGRICSGSAHCAGVVLRGILFAFFCVSFVPQALFGQERPYVAYLDLPVVRPGYPQKITLHGRNLQEVTGLLADTQLDVELIDRKSAVATFRVIPLADAWLGMHMVRAVTPAAVSPPQLFLIDELPPVEQNGNNHSPGEAQSVTVPAAVVGRTTQGKLDYYRFELSRPTELTFEVVARRLGIGPDEKLGGDETGRLLTIDPVLRLLDSGGRELLLVDDTPGLTSDIRFRHRFEQAGKFLAVIHDVQYRGGPQHQYVLRIGDFPDAAVCYPAGGPFEEDVIAKAATSDDLLARDAAARHLPQADTQRVGGGLPILMSPSRWRDTPGGTCAPPSYRPSPIGSSDELLDGVRWVSAQSEGGLRSLALPYLDGQMPEVNEREPNDTAVQAPLVPLPVAVNGRLQCTGDVDYFALQLNAGQKVRLTTVGRKVGSTIVAAMHVLGPDGATVARSVEEGTAAPEGRATDPRLDLPPVTLEAKIDGRHVVQVFRRLGRTGSAAVYQLKIEPFAGSFSLRGTSDFLTVPRGGTVVFGVDVLRDQYDGRVDVTAAGTLDGVSFSSGSVIGGGVTRAVVAVSAPADLTDTRGWFVVRGRAQVNDIQIRRIADLTSLYDAPPGLRPNQGHFFFLRPLPPVVARRFALIVTEPAPFALEVPEKQLTIEAGDSATVPIVRSRSAGFRGSVALRLAGLPATIRAEIPKLSEAADRVNIRLKTAKDISPGQYLFAVVGESTINDRKRSNATPPVTLVVKGCEAQSRSSAVPPDDSVRGDDDD